MKCAKCGQDNCVGVLNTMFCLNEAAPAAEGPRTLSSWTGATYTNASGIDFTTEDVKEMRFIEAMQEAERDWMVYSGRAMYGRKCPAVCCRIDEEHEVRNLVDDVLRIDQLGKHIVLYTG